MAAFTLEYNVPYEGITRLDFDTLEAVKKWIRENKSTYDWDYGNLTLYPAPVPTICVYELMKGDNG